jgi:hypothetical protein
MHHCIQNSKIASFDFFCRSTTTEQPNQHNDDEVEKQQEFDPCLEDNHIGNVSIV